MNIKIKAIIIVAAIALVGTGLYILGGYQSEDVSADQKTEKTSVEKNINAKAEDKTKDANVEDSKTSDGKDSNKNSGSKDSKSSSSKDSNKSSSNKDSNKTSNSGNKNSNSGNKSSSSSSGGNSGNKNNSSGGSSSGGSSSAPAHNHSFQPVYTTVTKYRTEQRVVGQETICSTCRAIISGFAVEHCRTYGCEGYYTGDVYETVEVPYTEQVISHYKCSCGQVQ